MKIIAQFDEDACWFFWDAAGVNTELHPPFEVPDQLWRAYLDAVGTLGNLEAQLLEYRPKD